jgi:predicted nicotinamide N-methyase
VKYTCRLGSEHQLLLLIMMLLSATYADRILKFVRDCKQTTVTIFVIDSLDKDFFEKMLQMIAFSKVLEFERAVQRDFFSRVRNHKETPKL